MKDKILADAASELRRLIERVEPMLGAAKALEWVAAPNTHLSGKAPRELITTPEGRARLESHLLSLEDATFL